jgi:hypothetical protein
MAPAISTHHAEWLSLVETGGPFLSVPVLSRALPQGLDAPDRAVTARLREARTQLAEDQTLHRAWCEFVLHDVLEFGDAVVAGPEIPPGLEHRASEQGETVRPDLVVVDRSAGPPQAVLLVTIHHPTQQLERRLVDAAWSASPIDRIATLCRAARVPLGLTTNGRSWTLVWARPGESTGVCTWDAELWLEEPLTLRAFRTLLGAHRFFTVAANEALPTLLEESAQSQQEVTDRLGAQVREAVELLIDALDRADRDRHGQLLGEIANEELYRASVTVMMRLVFLFVAEERRLLPLDDALYAQSYAASSLREQLEERATRFGEDPLERSAAAWYRLLALFRAVHGGIEHEALRLPAYGGGLFDPDRYPFLEGRADGSSWHHDASHPLPVDDRTVLHLLSALQVLEEPGRAGQPRAAVRLSFRALDVEQIGHVYEGLLDHTAVRTFDAAVGLVGQDEAEISIIDLERARDQGDGALIALLKDNTKKSPNSLRKALDAKRNPDREARLLAVCDNDRALRDRLLPFLGVVRDDLRDDPRVFLPGALYVTKALERRSSGTYYTPRSLAEEVVLHALDPIVYSPGPAEQLDASKWKLKSARDLLDLQIADIAMGSGAFLVAACRYLAARLLEAWSGLGSPDQWTVFGEPRSETSTQLGIPSDPAEREVLAQRLIAERCLYGVDKNPLAVEMAKLSLWLTTLAKDRPFSFLDHALKEGDSLRGVVSSDQVRAFHIDPRRGSALRTKLRERAVPIDAAVSRAFDSRRELESFVVRDIHDAQRKISLNADAVAALREIRLLADVVTGAAVAYQNGSEMESALVELEDDVAVLLDAQAPEDARDRTRMRLQDVASRWLSAGSAVGSIQSQPFHWPLEFPEVYTQGGFHAIVANPPFLGNKYWKSILGSTFQRFWEGRFGDRLGKPDLVVLFLARMTELIREPGSIGTLATQSVTEVDSRALIEKAVLSRASISRARSARRWPGSATVTVSEIWLTTAQWRAPRILDGTRCDSIGADLRAGANRRMPSPIMSSPFGFEGVHNGRGQALVLAAADDIAVAGAAAGFVRPYVSGNDLTSGDPLAPSRSVIDLTGLLERDLEALPRLLRTYLADVVLPTRTPASLASYKGLADRWWTFWNTREDLFARLREEDSCVAMAAVAKFLMPFELPSAWVYTNKVIVFGGVAGGVQTLLLSSCFDMWQETYGGTMGKETRVMKIADVVNTFPLPGQGVDPGPARAWQRLVVSAVRERAAGATDVMNGAHDAHATDERSVAIRRMLQGVDEAVWSAYGWDSSRLSYTFSDTPRGIRFGLEEKIRADVLEQLITLNLERRSAEDSGGVQSRRKRRISGRRAQKVAGQSTMFSDD